MNLLRFSRPPSSIDSRELTLDRSGVFPKLKYSILTSKGRLAIGMLLAGLSGFLGCSQKIERGVLGDPLITDFTGARKGIERKNPSRTLAAVKRRCKNGKNISAELLTQKNFVLDLIQECNWVWHIIKYDWITEENRDDADFMMKVLKILSEAGAYSPEILTLPSERLKRDTDFMLAAISLFPYLADYYDGDFIALFEGDLRRLNIDFPERFQDNQMLFHIIRNRSSIESNQKPVALYIYPKIDYNGAFQKNQISESIRNSNYFTLYFEAGNDSEVMDAFWNSGVKLGSIHFAEFGAHGNRYGMNYGMPPQEQLFDDSSWLGQRAADYKWPERLDVMDLEELKKLSPFFANGAVIVLKSCSTGQGKEDAINMANLFKLAIPQATVFAPQIDANTIGYTYGEKNIKNNNDRPVTGVRYLGGPSVLYEAEPSGEVIARLERVNQAVGDDYFCALNGFDVPKASIDFKRDVIEASHSKPVHVIFEDPDCGNCIQNEILSQRKLAESRDELAMVRIDIKSEPELARKFSIDFTRVPVEVVFVNGKSAHRTSYRRDSCGDELGLEEI